MHTYVSGTFGMVRASLVDAFDHGKAITIYTILALSALGIVVIFALLIKRESKDANAVEQISLQSRTRTLGLTPKPMLKLRCSIRSSTETKSSRWTRRGQRVFLVRPEEAEWRSKTCGCNCISIGCLGNLLVLTLAVNRSAEVDTVLSPARRNKL